MTTIKNKIIILFIVCFSMINSYTVQAMDFSFPEYKYGYEYEKANCENLGNPSELYLLDNNMGGIFRNPWNPGGVGTPDPEEGGSESTGGLTPIGTSIMPLLLMSLLFSSYLFINRRCKTKIRR